MKTVAGQGLNRTNNQVYQEVYQAAGKQVSTTAAPHTLTTEELSCLTR